MGNGLIHPKGRLIVFGLPDAGSTTFLNTACKDQVDHSALTVGFPVRTGIEAHSKLELLSLQWSPQLSFAMAGGLIRRSGYLTDGKLLGIIHLVDVSIDTRLKRSLWNGDPEGLWSVAESLVFTQSLLQEEKLSVPIVIFANKVDLLGDRTDEKIKSISQMFPDFPIFPCSSLSLQSIQSALSQFQTHLEGSIQSTETK